VVPTSATALRYVSNCGGIVTSKNELAFDDSLSKFVNSMRISSRFSNNGFSTSNPFLFSSLELLPKDWFPRPEPQIRIEKI